MVKQVYLKGRRFARPGTHENGNVAGRGAPLSPPFFKNMEYKTDLDKLRHSCSQGMVLRGHGFYGIKA